MPLLDTDVGIIVAELRRTPALTAQARRDKVRQLVLRQANLRLAGSPSQKKRQRYISKLFDLVMRALERDKVRVNPQAPPWSPMGFPAAERSLDEALQAVASVQGSYLLAVASARRFRDAARAAQRKFSVARAAADDAKRQLASAEGAIQRLHRENANRYANQLEDLRVANELARQSRLELVKAQARVTEVIEEREVLRASLDQCRRSLAELQAPDPALVARARRVEQQVRDADLRRQAKKQRRKGGR